MRRSLLVAFAFLAGCSDDPAATAPEEDAAADSVAVPIDTGIVDGAVADSAMPDSSAEDADTATSSDAEDGSTADVAVDVAPDVVDSAMPEIGPDVASCPAPTGGVLHVGPTGDDTSGNGSTACPLKTIAAAVLIAETATGATTIELAAGTAVAPVIYGTSCTGGAPCDSLPIHVPATVTKGLVIRGAGVAAGVRVVGGTSASDNSVFNVLAPNVGFENLTVAPRRVYGGPTGFAAANGIEFLAPAASAEASVTNVVIDGVLKSATSEATGSGIVVARGTSPTLGPGLTIKGGARGIQVSQGAGGASKPIVTSSAAAPTLISDTQNACIELASGFGSFPIASLTLTSSSTADPGRLHLRNCGTVGLTLNTATVGPTVSMNRTLIDSTDATMALGVLVAGASTLTTADAVTITGLTPSDVGAFAISVRNTSSLTATAGLVVSGNKTSGLRFSDSARGNLDGIVANDNGASVLQEGLYCTDSAQVKLRNSTFLGNAGPGVMAESSCALDLGAVGSPGNNVFQRTSHKNARVGLCYLSSVAATATSSTWSCGLAATAACVPSTTTSPKPNTPFSCLDAGTFDYFSPMSTLTVPSTPQTCCGL